MNQAQTIALYQPLLQSIAYNIVRCKQDAEDIVQETFIKWLTVDHERIQNTKAYLIKAVTNNCLSHLHAIRKKKEEYLDAFNSIDLMQMLRDVNFNHLDIDVELRNAFRLMQEKLQPLERAVFLLKEAFDFDYDELQLAFDKKKDHCRQLVSRARKKLEEASRVQIDLPNPTTLMESFRQACTMENASDFVAHLKEDIGHALGKKG